jgi:cytochrome c556
MHYYPRLDSYDRSTMKDRRQRFMSQHDDAMDSLADMLYGKYRFDREDAIELAHEIELLSNENLWNNFHPGAVVTAGSNTSTALWGNEEAFKSYADAMRTAATGLRTELQKTPKQGESAIYANRSKGFDYRKPSDGEAVEPMSPEIFGKFDNLASSCRACHAYFRLPDW